MRRRLRFRVAVAVACAISAALGLACSAQRGGEPLPLDRRIFHETPPPEMVFAERPDAAEEDAAPDAAKPPPKRVEPKRDGGSAWAAPPSGYLEQLGSEFRRLRPVPLSEYEAGHSKGRKRQVMNELGRLLVNASRDTVVRIMGPADADAKPGSGRWGPTGKQDGRAAQRLIYQWRGWKDYLIFELDGQGHVIRSEWYLSRE